MKNLDTYWWDFELIFLLMFVNLKKKDHMLTSPVTKNGIKWQQGRYEKKTFENDWRCIIKKIIKKMWQQTLYHENKLLKGKKGFKCEKCFYTFKSNIIRFVWQGKGINPVVLNNTFFYFQRNLSSIGCVRYFNWNSPSDIW